MQKLWIFGIIVFLLYISPVALFGWEQAVYPKDKVTETDLLKAGDKIINEGTIKGDMLVAGTTIRNQGHVSGDLLGLGSYIHQNGRVEGDGRLVGTEILIDGVSEKNLSLAGLRVNLGQESWVRGNFTAVADNIELYGKVEGNLVIKGNSVTLSGEFPKNVEIYANSLTILPRSKFGGSVTYFGKKPANVNSSATFATPLVKKPPISATGWKQVFESLIGLLVLAALVALLLPKSCTLMAKRLVEKPGQNFLSGLLFLLLTPVVLIGLFLLKVGSQSAMALLSAYMGLGSLSLFLAQITWGTAVGKLLWGIAGKTVALPAWGQTLTLLVQTLVGSLCFALLGLIPYAGIILQILMAIFTLGAMLTLGYSAARWPHASVPGRITRNSCHDITS